MELKEGQKPELLNCILELGELMLGSGAEISRVEDTLIRIASAYGAVHVDAFVITSIISLSIEFSDTDFVSETRRIYSSTGTDFYRLEKLNELSRRICAGIITLEDFHSALNDIVSMRKPFALILSGSILAAGSFTLFFGGTFYDGLVSSVFAVMICLLQKYIEFTETETASSNLLISFITGLFVGLTCWLMPSLHMDKILIGDIMLLIPGLAMTNAVRNILVGNTISGVIRITESLIWAGALAGGFMTSMIVLDIIL